MPRNQKIDEAEVLAVYERTHNAAEAARQTGIHENTARQIVRKHLGQCTRCMAPVVIGKTMCATCLDGEKKRISAQRKKRKRSGVCVNCGAPRTIASRLHCQPCHEAALDRNEQYRKRKGVQSPRQKQDDFLERYGPDAWKRWQHADGKCEACGAPYGETTVHLHHVDEDRTNNTFENFACLCFDCHRAVHRLISSRDRKAFVAWFERTYPQHALR